MKKGSNAVVLVAVCMACAHVLQIILLIAGVMVTATFYNTGHGAHPLTPTGM
jgi:hypothetical protein